MERPASACRHGVELTRSAEHELRVEVRPGPDPRLGGLDTREALPDRGLGGGIAGGDRLDEVGDGSCPSSRSIGATSAHGGDNTSPWTLSAAPLDLPRLSIPYGGEPVRLATWNCRMAVDRKRAAIDRLRADIVVVPECERDPALAREPGVSFAWKGDNPRKGLAVVGFGGWTVTPADRRAAFPWTLPVTVTDPTGRVWARLVAVWTVAGKGRPSYAAQAAAVLDALDGAAATLPLVLAGDFNASVEGASAVPHGFTTDRLTALGLHSAYHHLHGVAHGAEQAMTLRWIGPGRRVHLYHCDYVFLSSGLAAGLRSVDVGSIEEWIESGLSDHAPVIVELGFPGR